MAGPAQSADLQNAIRIQISKGQEAFAASDYVNALKYFVEWANIDRENQKAREHVAETLHRLGRTDQAIAMYKNIAEIYMAAGSIIKAIAIQKTILTLDPQNQEVKAQLLSIFGGKVPAELDTVLKAPTAPATKKKDRGEISAEDLGLEELDDRQQKAPAKGDELNNVFSEILGEDTELKDFRPQSESKNAFARTPLFSELTAAELNTLIDKLKLVQFSDQQVICKEGDPGHIMYVIVQGEVKIQTQKKDGSKIHLATLGEGDFFGEGGFVTGHPRTASVLAHGELKALEITKDNFDAATQEHPRMKEVLEVFYHHRISDRAMAQSELFGSLPSFRRAELMQSFSRKPIKDKEIILKEGEPCESFYLIKVGKVEILSKEKTIAALGPGEFFGEVGILTGKPLGYSARAQGEGELLGLKKIDMEGIMQMFPESEALLKRIVEQRSKQAWGKS